MTRKRKILLAVIITVPLLFVAYLAFNGWHLLPQRFVTYGGIGDAPNDTAATAKQYRKFCAGCHGNDMATFVNHKWKFGKTRSAVFKAIKYGYPTTGMPAYDVTFNDKQIYSLTDYLLNGITANSKKNKEEKNEWMHR